MTKRAPSASLRTTLLKAVSIGALAASLGLAMAPNASAIVANGETNDPDSLIDTENLFPNVGQIMIDQFNYNGGAFVCTATLINPRMMLTASHCVSVDGGSDASFYTGEFGARVGVTFLANPRTGPEGNIAIDYLFDGVENPYALTMSDVIINPGYDGFPEGDVAILALNTPVPTRGVGTDEATIATMPVMMSRLDQLERIWTVGYGTTGYGYDPNTSITRRRVAQNMLGFIGSFNEFQDRAYTDVDWEVLGLYINSDFQTFYMTDFDDPLRGTDDEFPYDFDVFPGDALSTDDPHTSEGMSNSGDSGGPLFADLPGGPVQLTVNSGGAFFNLNVAASGYFGGVNFQTPLYLYANWIALNNPYKYLVSKDGNSNWTDLATWQEVIDPAFVVRDADGNLVNGLAPVDQGQVEEEQASIGDINKAPFCFLDGTGLEFDYYPPGYCSVPAQDETGADAAIATTGNNRGTVLAQGGTVIGPGVVRAPDIYEIPPGKSPNDPPSTTDRPGYGTVWAPRSWVPNNTDGDTSDPGAPATYFDVTLAGSGVVTLSDFSATIDRLALVSATRELAITDTGSLTTWLSPEIWAGQLTVDGALISHRNIWQMGGIISGHGTITLDPTSLFAQETGDTLYNVAGIISPGELFTAETLTIDGNVQFSKGSAYAATLNAGLSDLIHVTGGGALDSDGAALRLTVLGDSPRYSDTFRVIQTGDGLLSGSFVTNKDDLPGVLYASYGIDTSPAGADYGVLTIEAEDFLDYATFAVPEAATIAGALDATRALPGGYTALSSIYDVVDVLGPADLGTVFQTMVPYNAIASIQAADLLGSITTKTVTDRADDVAHGGGRGLSMAGADMLGLNPQVASADPYDAMMMGAAAVAAAQAQAADTVAMRNAMLKEGYGVFLTVSGLVDAQLNMTGGLPDADIDGYTGTLGLDYTMGDSFIGGAVTYYSGDVDEVFGILQRTEVDAWGATIYGGARFDQGFVTVHAGYSSQSYDLGRTIPAFYTIVPGDYDIEASPDGDTWSLGGKVGYDVVMDGGMITPFVSIDGQWISLDSYTETGSVAAMTFDDSETATLRGRLGVDYTGTYAVGGGVLKPRVGFAVAGDFVDDDAEIVGSFADFAAVPMTFDGHDRKNFWFEYAFGLEYAADNYGLSVTYAGADTGQAEYGTVAGRLSVAW